MFYNISVGSFNAGKVTYAHHIGQGAIHIAQTEVKLAYVAFSKCPRDETQGHVLGAQLPGNVPNEKGY